MINALAVVGVDIVNARHVHGDQDLIVGGSGGVDLDVLEDFWAAGAGNLNSKHAI